MSCIELICVANDIHHDHMLLNSERKMRKKRSSFFLTVEQQIRTVLVEYVWDVIE